jgi:hypothetical protein
VSDCRLPCPCAGRAARLAVLGVTLALAMPLAVVADDLRDPLRPPVQQQPAAANPVNVNPADWRLASTLVADGRRVAVINGRVVAPGQSVDGARVLAVSRGEVRLRVGDQRFTIRSSTPSIRTTRGEEPAS